MTAILKCDQAIFTSIRGPMGEGYRIVASCRGIKSEEKQAITRSSPSHEALCWSPEEEPSPGAWFAAAFYPLPTGRLCVAYSCYAGMEHTARGGQRVYTHAVILDAQHFAACGFNAMHVIRAMIAGGLNEPRLKPPQLLPELTLCVEPVVSDRDSAALSALDGRLRRAALRLMFEQRNVALPRGERWVEAVEGLLLGLPGPLRAKTSFTAGLKFASSRNHRLQVFRDESPLIRAKVEAQAAEFLTVKDVGEEVSKSAWVRCVDAMWNRGALDLLDRRTSRAFADATPAAFERVGALYTQIDSIPTMPNLGLLTGVLAQVENPSRDVEEQVRGEFVADGRKELLARFGRVTPEQFEEVWPQLAGCARRGGTAALFVDPLIAVALRTLARLEPLRAAESACEVVAGPPKSGDMLLEDVLAQLCRKAAGLAAEHAERMSSLRDHLTSLRPNSSMVKTLCASLDAASVSTTR